MKGWIARAQLVRQSSGAARDDRNPLLALCEETDGGAMLGNMGYRGEPAAELLAAEAELLLLTRSDAPDRKFLLSQVRQAIGTSFSQLWHQFIDRIFSGSWKGRGIPSNSRYYSTTLLMRAWFLHHSTHDSD
jgi:hypothetical protein